MGFLMNDNGDSRRWIVLDLDGTLCDCSHRVHLAQAKQWDEFHAGIMDDKPYPDTVDFIKMVWSTVDYQIVVCTGRPETYRKATWEWIYKYNLEEYIDNMVMRPEKDYSPDHELKIKMIYDFFGGEAETRSNVLLVLDDRERVVEAWRNAGFSCWQVNVGKY